MEPSAPIASRCKCSHCIELVNDHIVCSTPNPSICTCLVCIRENKYNQKIVSKRHKNTLLMKQIINNIVDNLTNDTNKTENH
jgi:hypothetical protein